MFSANFKKYLRPGTFWNSLSLHHYEYHWRRRHWRFDLDIDPACPITFCLGVNLRLKQLAIGVPFIFFVTEYK